MIGHYTTGWAPEEAERFIGRIMTLVRDRCAEERLDQRKLPQWFSAASVRYGWIGDTVVSVLEGVAQMNDRFNHLGPVQADTAVLLDIPGLESRGFCRQWSERNVIGAYGEGAPPLIQLPHKAAWTNAGYPDTQQGAIILFGLSFQMDVSDTDSTPALMRYVPLAIYASKAKRDHEDQRIQWYVDSIVKYLRQFSQSEEGKVALKRREEIETLLVSKKSSVIVFGSYSEEHVRELRQARDFLAQKGYAAVLIGDLIDIPMMSLEEKVRHWSNASRFCVMIDREPSGHIKEYEILKQGRTILALLRPAKSRSTYMIGNDHLVDVNFINVFEFLESPLQVIDDAVTWAEGLVRKREEAYQGEYPWRSNSQ